MKREKRKKMISGGGMGLYTRKGGPTVIHQREITGRDQGGEENKIRNEHESLKVNGAAV